MPNVLIEQLVKHGEGTITSDLQHVGIANVAQLLRGSHLSHSIGLTSQEGLTGVILLGGSVRASALSNAADRSVMDLPVVAGMTLLDLWGAQIGGMSERFPGLSSRLVCDQRAVLPMSGLMGFGDRLSVERDPQPFRGTGGLLSDVVRDHGDDDYVLVADAAQVLTFPCLDLWQAMAARGADVVLTAGPAGEATGIMLVRCGVLRSVQSIGYADLKEQVFPALRAAGHDIRVLRLPRRPSIVLRDARDYLEVVRMLHTLEKGPASVDPWSPRFSLVEDAASVASTARVYDSIVMRGARVAKGATVVRSIICPGADIRPGERVADQLVGATHRHEIGKAQT